MILEAPFLHSNPGNPLTMESIMQLGIKFFKNMVEQAFVCIHLK